MEKFSKWRRRVSRSALPLLPSDDNDVPWEQNADKEPFLPPVPPSGTSPLLVALASPLCLLSSILRAVLLGAVALVHLLLVEGALLALTPISPLHRLVSCWVTAVTCRLALGVVGYYWIDNDLVSPKRGGPPIAQSLRPSRPGDLIITNWTSYIDILYLAYLHNPVFLLPVFGPLPSDSKAITGRHTGTGSANISSSLPGASPDLLGYVPISLFALLARTGSLPPISLSGKLPVGGYTSLRAASKALRRPIAVLPEGTTSNGRAILRLPPGVLADTDLASWNTGMIWVSIFKHPSPTPWSPSATCSLPTPLSHLFLSLLWTPLLLLPRNFTLKTLHPAASPSSPSFLPTEILSAGAGGLEGVGKDGEGAWREAIGQVMAETGRVRRVKGMGWVEKRAFLEFWEGGGGKKRR